MRRLLEKSVSTDKCEKILGDMICVGDAGHKGKHRYRPTGPMSDEEKAMWDKRDKYSDMRQKWKQTRQAKLEGRPIDPPKPQQPISKHPAVATGRLSVHEFKDALLAAKQEDEAKRAAAAKQVEAKKEVKAPMNKSANDSANNSADPLDIITAITKQLMKLDPVKRKKVLKWVNAYIDDVEEADDNGGQT